MIFLQVPDFNMVKNLRSRFWDSSIGSSGYAQSALEHPNIGNLVEDENAETDCMSVVESVDTSSPSQGCGSAGGGNYRIIYHCHGNNLSNHAYVLDLKNASLPSFSQVDFGLTDVEEDDSGENNGPLPLAADMDSFNVNRLSHESQFTVGRTETRQQDQGVDPVGENSGDMLCINDTKEMNDTSSNGGEDADKVSFGYVHFLVFPPITFWFLPSPNTFD